MEIFFRLGEVCKYIKEVHNMDQSYVSVKLDMDTIHSLHLNINAEKVKHAMIYGAVMNALQYVNWKLFFSFKNKFFFFSIS